MTQHPHDLKGGTSAGTIALDYFHKEKTYPRFRR